MINIRASQTSGWNDCPRRGAARAYKDIIEKAGFEVDGKANYVRGVASSLGTAVHVGAAHALRKKIDGESVSLDDMIDVSNADFDEAVCNGLSFDSITGKPSVAKIQIERLLKVYFNAILPNINPIMTEQFIQAELKGGHLLTAHPDVLEINSVHDLKTGKEPYEYHAQLGSYSLLAKANNICIPEKLIIDWIQRTAISKTYIEPKSIVFNVEICEAEAKSTIKSIISQVKEFQDTGDPVAFPANCMSNLCSVNYCPCIGTDFCKLKEN